ncbi:acetylcholine receptor subunit beta-like, partial [Pezoporus wallicus]|uniref:acetylcholine receptor subunit beta-like n=1 Tax=Pezoporus wallicus TaxID=35540 RepID=UPI0025514D01
LRLLRIPAELLWLPDVGLDNNNDGEFGVSLNVRAVVTSDGSVHWRPPALFRSHCPIKVSHFPFDWQNCSLRFRSSSYGPGELRLRLGGDPGSGGGGVELSEDFQENGQWELRQRSGRAQGPAGLGAVSFALLLRRKPLFYLATVLVPCVLLTLLASAVFYLPPDAGEKLTLSLFALLTLTVFLLLLADKVPATSLALPLIARHLTATLLLLALGVALSVAVLNVHHRGPGTHRLPPALHRLLLQRLPPLLGLHCPPAPPLPPEPRPVLAPPGGSDEYFLRRPRPGAGPAPPPAPLPPPELREAAAAVAFIARSLREQQRQRELQELWHRAALALDRLLLWAFLA